MNARASTLAPPFPISRIEGAGFEDIRMRWEDDRLSDNVQDDRGVSFGGGGFGGPIAIGGGGLGLVVVVVLALVFGVDPRSLLDAGGAPSRPAAVQTEPQGPRPDDQDARFARVVLGYT